MIDYYHEAGHTLMAYLFPELFIIEYVTLDTSKSRLHDQLAKGGLKVKVNKTFKDLSLEDHDVIILELFSGYIADGIFNNYKLFENFSKPEFWASKLGTARYGGDIERMNNNLIALLPNLRVTQVEYFCDIIEYLDDLFRIEEVNNALDAIADAIFNKEDKTLTFTELEVIIETTDLPKWWSEYGEVFRINRKSTFKKTI